MSAQYPAAIDADNAKPQSAGVGSRNADPERQQQAIEDAVAHIVEEPGIIAHQAEQPLIDPADLHAQPTGRQQALVRPQDTNGNRQRRGKQQEHRQPAAGYPCHGGRRSGRSFLGKADRQAIDEDGEQRDHQAGQDALAELGLAHRRQHFPADVLEAADDGGDDDHRQSRHRRLIEADENLRQCGRHFDLPELLAARAAAHQPGLADIGWHAVEPEHGVAHHRRRRVDGAGDQPDHRAEAEQKKQRDKIGEGRHGLHQVECAEQCRPQPRSAMTQHAKPKAKSNGDRHGQQHQRQRAHALRPVAGKQDVGERQHGKGGELRTTRFRGEYRDSQHYRRPRQPDEDQTCSPHRCIEHGRKRAESRLHDRDDDIRHGVDALDIKAHGSDFSRTSAPTGPGASPQQQPSIPESLWPELSRRERELVQLILAGHPTAKIAERLSITVGTVKNHRRRIYEKLDITTERELFLQFFQHRGPAI